MVGENFQIDVVHITGVCIRDLKNWIDSLLLMPPQARFLSSHSERGKLLSNQRQNFFKIEPLCLRGERNCKSGGKAKSDQN